MSLFLHKKKNNKNLEVHLKLVETLCAQLFTCMYLHLYFLPSRQLMLTSRICSCCIIQHSYTVIKWKVTLTYGSVTRLHHSLSLSTKNSHNHHFDFSIAILLSLVWDVQKRVIRGWKHKNGWSYRLETRTFFQSTLPCTVCTIATVSASHWRLCGCHLREYFSAVNLQLCWGPACLKTSLQPLCPSDKGTARSHMG